MGMARKPSGIAEVVAWTAAAESEEAGWVTNLVLDAHDAGVAYRDMAVLVRSRAVYRVLVEAFSSFDVPVQPGGRTACSTSPRRRFSVGPSHG